MPLTIFRRFIKHHKINSNFVDHKGNLRLIFKAVLIVFLVVFLIIWRRDLRGDRVNSETLAKILFSKSEEELIYEEQIKRDIAKQIPGFCDHGKPCFLEGDEKELGELSYAAQGINVLLSDYISYNRTPPDIQNEKCKSLQYDLKSLPKASVIIIFYEEPYSVLLRTVHSILNTVPPEVLEEIILVDDFSTLDDLKGKLQYYIKTRLPKKVKLLRLLKQ